MCTCGLWPTIGSHPKEEEKEEKQREKNESSVTRIYQCVSDPTKIQNNHNVAIVLLRQSSGFHIY